jgi:hypothetical protein
MCSKRSIDAVVFAGSAGATVGSSVSARGVALCRRHSHLLYDYLPSRLEVEAGVCLVSPCPCSIAQC